MIRIAGCLLLLLLPLIGNAVDRLSVNLASVMGEDFHLQGVQIGFSDITESHQTLTLRVEEMLLPEPFDSFSLIDVNCTKLQLDNTQIHCLHGTGIIKSSWLDTAKINFKFRFTEKLKTFQISKIKIAGGSVDVNAGLNQGRWALSLKAKAIKLQKLTQLMAYDALDVGAGHFDLRADVELDDLGLNKIKLDARLSNIGVQTQDGKYASEEFAANVKLDARRGRRQWSFNNTAQLTKGGVYIEPVYFDVTGNPIKLNAKGNWQQKAGRLELTQASVHHQGLGSLVGNLEFAIGDSITVDQAELMLTTQNLEQLSTTYLQPFFESTVMEGVSFSGELQAKLIIVQQALTNIGVKLSDIDITDEHRRFGVKRGRGQINWTNQRSNQSKTDLAWEDLQVFNIPVMASALSLNTDAGFFELNQRAVLPVLGGNISIEHFSWYQRDNQEPDVHFVGGVNEVSLQQLSSALAWHPINGTITGTIPGISHSQGRLKIKGELDARLFDGGIRIKKLASKGLFSNLPQLYAEIEIDNLDLQQLTGTFDFGGMEGRLSGYVRDLYLENWQPVQFDAWLGTPDDDDSRHRISQKAVNSISSIGGGGAANLLSRSVLRFFDSFGYDRLGIGCSLRQGVCQLKGVVETEQGYTIIKGGGLPRIEVIGYNPQVDWDVLMQRLKRVTGSD